MIEADVVIRTLALPVYCTHCWSCCGIAKLNSSEEQQASLARSWTDARGPCRSDFPAHHHAVLPQRTLTSILFDRHFAWCYTFPLTAWSPTPRLLHVRMCGVEFHLVIKHLEYSREYLTLTTRHQVGRHRPVTSNRVSCVLGSALLVAVVNATPSPGSLGSDIQVLLHNDLYGMFDV